MSDSIKLNKIIKLIQEEYTAMYNGCHTYNEPIYKNLEGVECNASQALRAYEPIYKRIMYIVNRGR